MVLVVLITPIVLTAIMENLVIYVLLWLNEPKENYYFHTNMNDYRLYILMRNDLPSMGPGRAAAQASHAANAFIHEWGSRRDVTEWTCQTKQGFGTAIVLSANKDQITKILRSRVIPQGWVIDPDYVVSISVELRPYLKGVINEISATDPTKLLIHRSEKTCAYVFGTKEQLEHLVGELPLYP
jgi:hypothetical protein